MSKWSFALLLYLSFSIAANAQTLEDLSFGTDSTFEIMTWNIEWFPKNGQATADSVSIIIQALDIDLLAVQEIDDTTMFSEMIDKLDGFECYFQSYWFGGLAYIYKTDVLQINDIYEIYYEEEFWRPFPRSPLVMDITYSGDRYFIINNHLKAMGDGYLDPSDEWDEETRRFDACNLLKAYIDSLLSDENVIVLGDMNDILTDLPPNNVFQNILDDSINYLFADMEIATGPSSGWSYPYWPSHIDHILITNELFDVFNNENSLIQTIEIDDYMAGGFDEYYEYISDHRPVALKLDYSSIKRDCVAVDRIYSLGNYPNPFSLSTTIVYQIVVPGFVRLDIYSMDGRLVETLVNEYQTTGNHLTPWNTAGINSGLYLGILTVDYNTMVQKLIVVR